MQVDRSCEKMGVLYLPATWLLRKFVWWLGVVSRTFHDYKYLEDGRRTVRSSVDGLIHMRKVEHCELITLEEIIEIDESVWPLLSESPLGVTPPSPLGVTPRYRSPLGVTPGSSVCSTPGSSVWPLAALLSVWPLAALCDLGVTPRSSPLGVISGGSPLGVTALLDLSSRCNLWRLCSK